MKSGNLKPPKVRDPRLRLMVEQLDHIEDRLGGGTGPAVDSGETAVLNLIKVVRSLIDHVEGMKRRTE